VVVGVGLGCGVGVATNVCVGVVDAAGGVYEPPLELLDDVAPLIAYWRWCVRQIGELIGVGNSFGNGA
jgi:hypothetical protein